MLSISIDRLEYLCGIMPSLLSAINAEEFKKQPEPGKWSKQEILGHLIDSAANNHQRFVRGQFELNPKIGYDPDLWNKHGYYREMRKDDLVAFWSTYNKHLLELVRRIPPNFLQRCCASEDGKLLSLEFLIDDYVEHMEHHLKQLVDY